VHWNGPFLDDLAITADGAPLVTDDVESGTNGWTATGFTRMTGSTSEVVSHYYMAENRVYSGYDKTLKTGPYNFGFANTKPDWVERFPYQNGMLVTYVDGEYGDNNTSAHPGHGQVLPVDARPTPVKFSDGSLLGNRRQPFDATFGQEATDAVTFHKNGVATTVPSSRGIPVFDDSDPNGYWDATNPQNSVQVAGEGVRMRVTKTDDGGNQLQVKVTFQ
jgi:immune inhibitor A